DLGGVPRKVTDGIVRLAELRRRQGDAQQAEALLGQAEGHPAALLVRGALALDVGDAAGASEAAERFLRRVGDADRFERIAGLELLVRARLELDERKEAASAVAELERLAAGVGTAPLRAAALRARGRLEGSAELLEDAAVLYAECGASYEAAHTRLEFGRALRAQGRTAEAVAAEEAARHSGADPAGARRGRLRRGRGAGAGGRPAQRLLHRAVGAASRAGVAGDGPARLMPPTGFEPVLRP